MSEPLPVVVSALDEEIAPFLLKVGARPHESRKAAKGGELRTFRGESAGREVAMAVIGDGAGPARQGLARLFDEIVPERLLLIGIAGGLSDDLAVGSLLQATTVRSAGDDQVRHAAAGSLGGLESGTVVSTDRILSTHESKNELFVDLGRPARCAVDLESWSVVCSAGETGVPWTVVRAISDASHEDLPLDFAALSNEEGQVVRSKVILSLLRHPVALKGVLEMRSRVQSCARDLALVAERWLLTGESIC